MKKKVLAGLLVSVLTIGALAGCGSSSSDSTDSAANTETEAEGDELVTLKVAASETPHAEILNHVKDQLAEEGVDLQVKVYSDYVIPNTAVEEGDEDANYFQHVQYLNSFNEENGTHLVDAGKIHYEPFGIYAGTKDSLDDIEDGDYIAIPNDTTNEARALLLLQQEGLITLNDGVDITATVNDIKENPHNLRFDELEAAQVSHAVDSEAFVVLNGNYAQQAGFDPATDPLALEEQDGAAIENYVNVIAVKEGNENNEAVKKLVEVLKSEEVQKWIEENYSGSVVPYAE